ncbi:MAG: PAS domain-containing sensor histidine kinase, partial [Bacteroidetes bacterium]|nr:PAS domain-containing sensor histidine kinase [Bacteroidota bacterium]
GIWFEKNDFEEELKRSEQRYSMAFHATHTATSVTNLRQGKFIDINDSFLALTGYAKDEIIGKTADELGILSLIQGRENLLADLRANKFLKNLVASIRKKNNEVLKVEATISLVEFNGEFCVISKINDITDRRATEDKLRTEREKAATYLQIAGVIMIVLNTKGEVELINKKGCQVLGYTAEEIIGKVWFDHFLPEEIREPTREGFLRVVKVIAEPDSSKISHILTKDGQVRTIAWNNTIIKDEEGRMISTLSSGEDITERIKAEEQLFTSERRFRSLIENSSDVILLTDEDIKVSYVSPSIEHILGYPVEQIMNSNAFGFVHPDDISEAMQVHENHIANPGVIYPLRMRVQHKDGTWRYMEGTVKNLIYDPSVQAIVTNLKDVTKVVLQQESIRTNEANLNALVENVNAAIWSIDLNKQIQISNSQTSELFSNIYDINIGRGDFIFDTIPGDGKIITYQEYEKIIGAESVIYEKEFLINNEKAFYEISGYPIADEQGIITGASYIARDITVRKKAEETVRTNEANLRTLIDNTKDSISSINAAMKLVTVNTVQRELFYSHNKVWLKKGDDFFNLIKDEKRRNQEISRFKRVMRGETLNFERAYNIRGDQHYYDVTVNPIIQDDGVITGAAYFARDITERKKSEEIIRQNEANLKALIENTNDFIYSFDKEGRIAAINSYYKKVLYYRFGEEITTGMNLFDYFPEDERKDLINAFDKGLSGERFVMDHHYTIDGEETYYETSVNPIVTGDTLIEGVSFFTRNITDRKKDEENIRKSEEKYRRLIENMREGVMYVDNEEQILFANNRLCEMTGYQEEELVGQNAYQTLLDASDHKELLKKIKTIQDGSAEQYEMRIKKKTGEYLWVMINNVPIHDEKDKIVGSMGTITDISELKKTEVRLMDTNRELNTFVYKASHDLKGPLASILGLVSLALDDITDEGTLQYLTMIDASSKRLEEILKDLLEAIRIKEENLRTGLVYFSDVIKEAKESMAEVQGYERVKFNTFISLRNRFYSDAKMISSIFMSIIDNAIKYQDWEKENPHINIRITDADGGVKIMFEDNGTGIHTDFQDKIFDMFFRGNQDSKGSGLGLYITKKAVEKLGGEIILQTEAEKFTRFTISLPSIKED